MTPDQLADHVAAFIDKAAGRVNGIGADQYSEGQRQKFEAMPLGQLFDWAEEELLDQAAYAVMLNIRLRRVQDRVVDELSRRLAVLEDGTT